MPDQAHILFLLEQSDPESIREGAQLAGEHREAEATPALIHHIRNPNIGVQEAVEQALRKIGGPVIVRSAIPLLRSEDATVRNLAMDLLRELGKSDLDSVLELLRDEDADIRIFAADILGSIGSALAVGPLCTALLHDPEANVRCQAAVSLGALGLPESAHCLSSALNDEEWVRFAVVEALASIRDASSIEALTTALQNASDLVAASIVDALGEMGDLKSVPILLRRMESSPLPLCNKIVKAVLSILGPHSLTLLGIKECDRLRGYLPAALEDEDPEIQDAAVKGFAALGGTGATAGLLRHASRLDPETEHERIAAAIEAMVKIGHTPELDQALREGDEQTMRIAMAVLPRVAPATAASLLMEIFWQRPRDAQREIILELADLAQSRHQDFFLDVLDKHQDGNVLRGTLLFLGRKGDPEQVFENIASMLDHPYNDVKETALEALIALHTPRVQAFFKQLVHSDDPMHKMMGAHGLGFFDIADSIHELIPMLNDENPDVRKVAVLSLGKSCQQSEESLSALERCLEDENSDVRMAAFEIIGTRADDRSIDNLIGGLSDPAPWVRIRCAERLGENKIAKAVEPLIGMLADENPLITVKAVEALGMIGGEKAFRSLLPLLEHPEKDLRAVAEKAVGSILQRAGK